MEKLAEAYEQANPEATIEVQQSDSTPCDHGNPGHVRHRHGIARAQGFRDGQGAQSQAIARDGIAVIVPVESAIEGLTSDQVKQIFSGKITSWGDVK